jgi:hypothetical protein
VGEGGRGCDGVPIFWAAARRRATAAAGEEPAWGEFERRWRAPPSRPWGLLGGDEENLFECSSEVFVFYPT